MLVRPRERAATGTTNITDRVSRWSTGVMDKFRTRELYSSSNGDRWHLCRDTSGKVFVLHQANIPSGGRVSQIELLPLLPLRTASLTWPALVNLPQKESPSVLLGLQIPKSGRRLANSLHHLNCVSTNSLDRLITRRGKVGPSLRFVEGLCLLKTIPFREPHAFGWGRPL
jgi:hypothetical protein